MEKTIKLEKQIKSLFLTKQFIKFSKYLATIGTGSITDMRLIKNSNNSNNKNSKIMIIIINY